MLICVHVASRPRIRNNLRGACRSWLSSLLREDSRAAFNSPATVRVATNTEQSVHIVSAAVASSQSIPESQASSMSSDPPLKPDSIVNKVAGNLSSKVQGAFKENWAGTVETGHPGGESNDQRYVTNPVTGAANSQSSVVICCGIIADSVPLRRRQGLWFQHRRSGHGQRQ